MKKSKSTNTIKTTNRARVLLSASILALSSAGVVFGALVATQPVKVDTVNSQVEPQAVQTEEVKPTTTENDKPTSSPKQKPKPTKVDTDTTIKHQTPSAPVAASGDTTKQSQPSVTKKSSNKPKKPKKELTVYDYAKKHLDVSTPTLMMCFEAVVNKFPDRFKGSQTENNVKALKVFYSTCSNGVWDHRNMGRSVLELYGPDGAFFDSDIAKSQH